MSTQDTLFKFYYTWKVVETEQETIRQHAYNLGEVLGKARKNLSLLELQVNPIPDKFKNDVKKLKKEYAECWQEMYHCVDRSELLKRNLTTLLMFIECHREEEARNNVDGR